MVEVDDMEILPAQDWNDGWYAKPELRLDMEGKLRHQRNEWRTEQVRRLNTLKPLAYIESLGIETGWIYYPDRFDRVSHILDVIDGARCEYY